MSDIICDDYTNGIDSLSESVEQMNVDNVNDENSSEDMSLPNALIVTNVDEQVFQNENMKVIVLTLCIEYIEYFVIHYC